MNPGRTEACPSATTGAPSPIAARTSGDGPTATIRPSRTPTASARGRANGAATVTVSDDGVGGADPAAGSGLRGLAARVEALNGRLDVDSPPGGGTRISAEIPLT